MSQSTTLAVYKRLGRRLNRFPQRAPSSPLLHQILEILFTPAEAHLAALLPLRPFNAAKAARIWKVPEREACKKLRKMAARGILMDIMQASGGRLYVLPPPMAGFLEFSLMRVRGDIDQQKLSRLLYEYINVEEDFIKDLFLSGNTSLGRVFVHEPALPASVAAEILDYERASEVIQSASAIAVGICYCRHKMEHVGRACNAPKAICMTFNQVADPLVRNGFARRVEAAECMDLLQQAYDCNLVQGGENVQRQVSFICNCCACCCEGLIAARKFGSHMPIHPANFIPRFNSQSCKGCGKCARICPAGAVRMQAAPGQEARPTAVVDETICLGCGICARNCAQAAIRLEARARRAITPVDMVHRTVLMAVERGLLQNLIFDNQALLSHRMMAAVLGAIFKLPPIKQAMARKQLQSIYLEALIAWKGDIFPTSPAKAVT
ncbi:MAG: 4Fe-4S dicluster domain-containing protein [Desulfobacteraceae bacterium]|nr:MAG: 4Fe-4S dicluster domain-containing protein [Desulfobacteraceae bacterium]